MANSYIEVTGEDFNEKVLQSPKLVVVNFSAENSNACQILDPEFEAVSKEYQDQVTFVKLNVAGQEELVSQWHVDGVPTLVFFKGGSEIYRIPGIVMRNKLRRQVEGVLLAS